MKRSTVRFLDPLEGKVCQSKHYSISTTSELDVFVVHYVDVDPTTILLEQCFAVQGIDLDPFIVW